MIRTAPEDLVAVRSGDKYYYALILSPIRLFGGNWCYAFHRTTSETLSPEELIVSVQPGFHAFVDFIWSKREGRIQRLAKKVDTKSYNYPHRLKHTFPFTGKAPFWFIYSMEFQQLEKVPNLTDEQKLYPIYERIDDILMAERIDQKWTPDQDPRI